MTIQRQNHPILVFIIADLTFINHFTSEHSKPLEFAYLIHVSCPDFMLDCLFGVVVYEINEEVMFDSHVLKAVYLNEDVFE